MKAGRPLKPLADVCQIKPPKAEARNRISDEGLVSFVPMEDLGINQKYLVPAQTRTLGEVSGSYTYFADGDVLLAKITPCFENGKLGIADNLTNGVGFGSSEYIVFRPSPVVAKEWLYYFLSQESFRVEGAECMSGAVGHKRVAKEFIESYLIPVPPLPEQHRIVAILDAAFDGIATAKANAEQNLQNARALFESHLQKVFTERGVGWAERSIGDICTLKSGSSVSVSLEKVEGEIPYVKVSDMTYAGNETEIVGSSRYLNITDVGKNAVFPAGTTIFPKRGGAILTNKKRLTALPICADLNIMGVIPPDNLLPRLLYYYFLNIDMRLLGSGSSIPQINNYDIAPLKISFPVAQDGQKAILQKLDELAAETQRLESHYRQKLAALEALKKSLLHQAFSGAL